MPTLTWTASVDLKVAKPSDLPIETRSPLRGRRVPTDHADGEGGSMNATTLLDAALDSRRAIVRPNSA